MRDYSLEDLKKIAKWIRYDMLNFVPENHSVHWGGCLSQVEILTTLFFKFLKLDPDNPLWPERDRLILSKGHGSYSLYSAMARRGFFPRERLAEIDKDGGHFPKHAHRLKLAGIEASTGALAQGLSMGIGMALAEKLDEENNYRIFIGGSDGECTEGQFWEAALSAAKPYKAPAWMREKTGKDEFYLDNLVLIIDNNKMTLDGHIEKIMPTLDIFRMFKAAGLKVYRCDGHNVKELCDRIQKGLHVTGRPVVIIASTIKGKGVSFMEGKAEWHAKALSSEQRLQALEEIEFRNKPRTRACQELSSCSEQELSSLSSLPEDEGDASDDWGEDGDSDD